MQQPEVADVELTKYLRGSPANKYIRPLFYQRVSEACSERTGLFLKVLNRPKINLVYLRSISFRGIPSECKGLRGIVWRLLLGLLPADTKSWEQVIAGKAAQYEQLKATLKMPRVPKITPGLGRLLTPDEDLAKEVKIDIKRTKRDMPFFGQRPGATEEEKKDGSPKKSLEEEDEAFLYGEADSHRQIISRMLYVFAKLNSVSGYVQGMNEIISVIYYCLGTQSGEEFGEHLESGTYFCFADVMGELKDSYTRQPDKSLGGVRRTMQNIGEILKRVDPDYAAYLAESKVDIQLFSLRWVMLLFAQDLDMERVIRLWDALLGDPERFLFLHYFVAQLVIDAKKLVVGREFYVFVKQVQNIPRDMDLHETLRKAGNMMAKDLKKDNYIGEHY